MQYRFAVLYETLSSSSSGGSAKSKIFFFLTILASFFALTLGRMDICGREYCYMTEKIDLNNGEKRIAQPLAQ